MGQLIQFPERRTRRDGFTEQRSIDPASPLHCPACHRKVQLIWAWSPDRTMRCADCHGSAA